MPALLLHVRNVLDFDPQPAGFVLTLGATSTMISSFSSCSQRLSISGASQQSPVMFTGRPHLCSKGTAQDAQNAVQDPNPAHHLGTHTQAGFKGELLTTRHNKEVSPLRKHSRSRERPDAARRNKRRILHGLKAGCSKREHGNVMRQPQRMQD